MEKYKIKLNERIYEVEVEEVLDENEECSTTSDFEEEKVSSSKVKNNVEKKPKDKIENEETISAPMPGDIVDVKVREGEKIKKGEVLMILEAMKMENEIVSPTDGNVSRINVNKGDSVNLGDRLVLIQ
ncbi:biotin/lipoyl-containing protein [Clostridium oceanicum]|uniref:Lipoyl-binding domain-containing protein n=1 Tax=Clostridium oceanicum TaxID=1543 RepID=A0ABN1J9H0_9CLOT